jgi:6-phosphogluconolactonase
MVPRAIAADMFVYFGTQQIATPGRPTGFRLAHFDSDTGTLGKPQLVLAADGPSYFVIHPDGRRLYSTNYTGAGGVSAYRIDAKSGALTLINCIGGGGAGTSYIGLDGTGRYALAANFETGHLAVFPIRPDGGLGDRTAYDMHIGSSINPQRQAHTYPHCIITDPSNRFALSTDLGLDKLFVYRFDEQAGTLTAAEPAFVTVKPGAGPRHVRFHPNGKWAYLICEMGSIINAYTWDARRGALAEFQSVSALPEAFKGENNSAELEIHPNGKFLYGSNRGDDSLVIFEIDQTSGKLSMVGRVPSRGKTPRNFVLDPTGHWMICTNQEGNSAVVFRVDQDGASLTQVGAPVEIEAPCCERFLAVGR